jgi:hypothetical protein
MDGALAESNEETKDRSAFAHLWIAFGDESASCSESRFGGTKTDHADDLCPKGFLGFACCCPQLLSLSFHMAAKQSILTKRPCAIPRSNAGRWWIAAESA